MLGADHWTVQRVQGDSGAPSFGKAFGIPTEPWHEFLQLCFQGLQGVVLSGFRRSQ
jgi:hypothetical protein